MMMSLWLTLRSVWSSGINSPSAVWRDLINLARIWASTIWEFRKSPTLQTELSKIVIFPEWTNLNMNVNLPSRVQITAFFENTIVSVRFFGWDILTNIQPTMKASTILPKISVNFILEFRTSFSPRDPAKAADLWSSRGQSGRCWGLKRRYLFHWPISRAKVADVAWKQPLTKQSSYKTNHQLSATLSQYRLARNRSFFNIRHFRLYF